MTHRAVVLVLILLALMLAQGCPRTPPADPATLPQDAGTPGAEPTDVVAPEDEAADEPTDEAADEPTDEAADEPTDEAADEPTDEAADEPTED